MKAFLFVTVVSVMMLAAKTISIFAAVNTCTATCSSAEKKNTENKPAQANTIEFDSNPFTILIPGNNF